MAGPDALQIRNQIDLSQFAGFPVYFFDFGFLLANVPKIATWNREKLESVIGARADNMLARADVRLPSAGGFHIIFSTRESALAQERANAICTDVLKHFFGTDSLIPEGARGFCRSADLKSVAEALGTTGKAEELNAATQQAAQEASVRTAAPVTEPVSLVEGMNALFRRHFGEEKGENRKFLFAPIWDSTSERIASFSCQPAQAVNPRAALAGDKAGGVSAGVHCTNDMAALAFALKGVWQLITRGDIGLVTVPVHIETLSWSKYRTAYLNELAHIEARLMGLLAFRIYGLDAGSSLSQVSQGVSVLRRHARRIFVHLPTVSVDFSHAGIIGVTGLGVSAPTHPGRIGEGPLDGLLVVANRLKRICTGQNAIAYIDNVSSVSAVGLLKSQGVRLISGPIFDPPSEEPGTVRPLPLNTLSGNVIAM